MYYTYIVECSDGTFYAGISTDLERRIAEHNGFGRGAKYTAGRRPVRLVHFQKFCSRAAACRAEARLKKLKRSEKMELIAEAKKIGKICVK